jgi:hypothetical protein
MRLPPTAAAAAAEFLLERTAPAVFDLLKVNILMSHARNLGN